MNGKSGVVAHIWNNFLEKVVPWDRTIIDQKVAIPHGMMDGMKGVNKFGRNPDVDGKADVWDGGGIYVPPIAAQLHNIVSSSSEDAGTVLSSGTFTEASSDRVIDSAATFITDGVAVHDIVLNDDSQDHSLVEEIVSETELRVHLMHHDTTNKVGENYRVVTPSGTGAAVAHIKKGLDTNMVEQTEFIVLNGTTNVLTVGAYLRINRLHIHGVGSNKTNVGIITAKDANTALVTAMISAGMGQTLMAFFTIPKGKHGYVTNLYATLNKSGGSNMLADFAIYERLWADSSNGGGDGELVFGYFSIQYGTPFNKSYDPYLYVSEFSDVWIRVEGVSAANADFSAGFDLILVNK